MKNDWLILEAKKWLGVHASSSNPSSVVDHFLRATGGSPGMAWCAAFTRFCADQVDRDCDQVYVLSEAERAHNILPKSESVLAVWKGIPGAQKSLTPIPGYIVAWEHFDDSGHATGLGHMGIVTGIQDAGQWFSTIEGNGSNYETGNIIDRNGGWVVAKTRSAQGGPRFRLLGFASAWPLGGK